MYANKTVFYKRAFGLPLQFCLAQGIELHFVLQIVEQHEFSVLTQSQYLKTRATIIN
jgi:hypothetical protein